MDSTKLQTVNRLNANTYANLVAKLITQVEKKTSARGSRYCSFYIGDSIDTIRVTSFGDKATEYAKLDLGKVYQFNNVNVYVRQIPEQYLSFQKFSTVPNEINITDKSIVIEKPLIEMNPLKPETKFTNIQEIRKADINSHQYQGNNIIRIRY